MKWSFSKLEKRYRVLYPTDSAGQVWWSRALRKDDAVARCNAFGGIEVVEVVHMNPSMGHECPDDETGTLRSEEFDA